MAAARSGAAVGPLLERGILRVTGKDRQDYLHRMCTQTLAGLAPGRAVHAAFLEAKGHVLAEGMVLVREEEILLDVDPSVAAGLAAHLSKFVIMDDVAVEDASAGFRVVPALGPEGVSRARALAGTAPAIASTRRGGPALDVVLPGPEAEAFRAALAAAGAVEVDEGDLEALRVLAGVPRFGADVDATRLPMEAALTASAISFEKGCYLGQEVVLRGTFRGQIQKGLVQLELPPGAGPGAALSAGGQEVGRVTSAAETPEGRLGLGYLRRAHWKAGERLATAGGEAVVRKVLVEERFP